MVVIYKLRTDDVRETQHVEFVNFYHEGGIVIIRHGVDETGYEEIIRMDDLEWLRVNPE